MDNERFGILNASSRMIYNSAANFFLAVLFNRDQPPLPFVIWRTQ